MKDRDALLQESTPDLVGWRQHLLSRDIGCKEFMDIGGAREALALSIESEAAPAARLLAGLRIKQVDQIDLHAHRQAP